MLAYICNNKKEFLYTASFEHVPRVGEGIENRELDSIGVVEVVFWYVGKKSNYVKIYIKEIE